MSTQPTLDLDFVRAQFPAFGVPQLRGQAFFENAGGSYACAAVIDRLSDYYRANKVQPYYPYPASAEAGELMDASYRRLAAYLGVSAQEVHLGPSTTQNMYVMAQAAMGWLQAGDEIIVTNQEHEANGGAWRGLAARGIVVKEWQVDPVSGALAAADLDQLLTPRTKLVAFTHCSNILGQINPVARIAKQVRDAGAISVVDGVSYAGHAFPDVSALGADVYCFSLYKTYGPHQGLMVVRERAAHCFSNQSHYFNADEIHKRWIPAGPDHAQVAAAQGIADYFDALIEHHYPAPPANRRAAVEALFHGAEQALLPPLLSWLGDHPRMRVLGPATAAGRAPTVAVGVDGCAPQTLCEQLAERNVMAGYGHFYSARLLDAMGIDTKTGVVRFSFVHYTSGDDINALTSALDQLLA